MRRYVPDSPQGQSRWHNAALSKSDRGIHQYIRVGTFTFVQAFFAHFVWKSRSSAKLLTNAGQTWLGINLDEISEAMSSNVKKPSPGRTQHMHPHARATSCPWCLHGGFEKRNKNTFFVASRCKCQASGNDSLSNNVKASFGRDLCGTTRICEGKNCPTSDDLSENYVPLSSTKRIDPALKNLISDSIVDCRGCTSVSETSDAPTSSTILRWNHDHWRSCNGIMKRMRTCHFSPSALWCPIDWTFRETTKPLQGFTDRGENPFLQGFSLAKVSSASCGHRDRTLQFFLWCYSQWRWYHCVYVYQVSPYSCSACLMFTMFGFVLCRRSALMLVLNPRERP